MRKYVLIPMLILFLTSCELIKDATEVEFKSKFKLGYVVELDENDNSVYMEKVISIADDDEALKYKDKIDKLEVDSIIVSITDYTGPESVVLNGNLKYSKEDETSGTIFADVKDLDITTLYNSGETYRLDYNTNEVVKLAK